MFFRFVAIFPTARCPHVNNSHKTLKRPTHAEERRRTRRRKSEKRIPNAISLKFIYDRVKRANEELHYSRIELLMPFIRARALEDLLIDVASEKKGDCENWWMESRSIILNFSIMKPFVDSIRWSSCGTVEHDFERRASLLPLHHLARWLRFN